MAGRIRLIPGAVKAAAVKSARYQAYQLAIAEEMIEIAKATFEARQRDDNEHRTSEHTPPKYIERFEIHLIHDGLRVYNTDLYSVHVEFGAHAGGKTPVLNYRPLSTAIEIMAAKAAGGA